MINDCRYFSSKQQLNEKIPVTLADSSSTYAIFIGTVELVSNPGNRLTLTDVLFVPELQRNLLCVRRTTLADYAVVFKKFSVEIVINENVLASGYVENGLYLIDFSVCFAEAGLGESNLSYKQLHSRLGHPNLNTVLALKKDEIVHFQGEIPVLCEPWKTNPTTVSVI